MILSIIYTHTIYLIAGLLYSAAMLLTLLKIEKMSKDKIKEKTMEHLITIIIAINLTSGFTHLMINTIILATANLGRIHDALIREIYSRSTVLLTILVMQVILSLLCTDIMSLRSWLSGTEKLGKKLEKYLYLLFPIISIELFLLALFKDEYTFFFYDTAGLRITLVRARSPIITLAAIMLIPPLFNILSLFFKIGRMIGEYYLQQLFRSLILIVFIQTTILIALLSPCYFIPVNMTLATLVSAVTVAIYLISIQRRLEVLSRVEPIPLPTEPIKTRYKIGNIELNANDRILIEYNPRVNYLRFIKLIVENFIDTSLIILVSRNYSNLAGELKKLKEKGYCYVDIFVKTKKGSSTDISVTDLSLLASLLVKYVVLHNLHTVIIIDDLTNLIIYNGYERVKDFILYLSQNIRESLMIALVNYMYHREEELELIEEMFGKVLRIEKDYYLLKPRKLKIVITPYRES